MLELDKALTEAFALHRSLRERLPAARLIKFPQIPAIFAESLVIASAKRLFGSDWTASFGGLLSDLVLVDGTGAQLRVEVKSTARHGFQELKAKDLTADALVWIHFGKRFQEGHGSLQVVVLRNPGKHISSPIRLDIPRLLRLVGETPDLRQIEALSIEEFLPPT